MSAIPDSHRDLLDAQVAALTTLGADGGPQSSLVWFLYEDGEVKISLSDARAKTKHLLKRPQISVLITDPASPMRYVDIRGRAETEPDPDYVFADRVGAKYGGADLRAHDGPADKRVVVTVADPKVYAVDMSA